MIRILSMFSTRYHLLHKHLCKLTDVKPVASLGFAKLAPVTAGEPAVGLKSGACIIKWCNQANIAVIG